MADKQDFAYSGAKLRTIAFPIGGIGTGCFSLSGHGELLDWEIFHRPNKLSLLPNTFFAIRTQTAEGVIDARVLQKWPDPPLMGDVGGRNFYGFGFGERRETGAGLKHMRDARFRGEYPFAWIDFDEPALPVEVSMMAYNPFIPLNVEDSALPAGIFEFTIHNPGSSAVEVSIAGSLFNAVGYRGHGAMSYVEHGEFKGTGDKNFNRYVQSDDMKAILMGSEVYAPDVPLGGTMALATTWKDTSHQTAWFRGAWFDSMQIFWDEFSAKGRLQDRTYDEPSPKNTSDTGSLALHAHLEPGETVRMPVFLTWHFPNFLKYWTDSYAPNPNPETWRVPYSKQFEDALDVAKYAAENEGRLRQESQTFHDALFGSTLPPYVLDAVSSQMSILKSTTVTLLEDGSLYGFEGVHSEAGCCEGSCNHVWNYALTHAYLFPSLERSMRHNDYTYNLHSDGRLTFRLALPLGKTPRDFHPAADGQMGGIMQVYRDWKLSGDTDWLREHWPRVKQSLEYAWLYWDYNQDGVMEGLQHNTYDIEFYGANGMMESWYLGALKCGVQMARAMGDDESAAKYDGLAEAGRKWTESNLYNGEFYEQIVDEKAAEHSPLSTDISLGGQRAGTPKYQYGSGCLSDQVIGAWMARVCGIGDILDGGHVRQTLASIYKYNYRENLYEHNNAQRVYALADEAALVLCTWPRGGRPDLPFVYSDEAWSGIEYQVAGHMIYEGMVEEGLTLVKSVRARYDGERRNPWNELECGSHYARSLASWSVLLALSGFECDLTIGDIGFKPALAERPFRCFWSTGTGWGTYSQSADEIQFRCDYGTQTIQSFFAGGATVQSVEYAGKAMMATYEVQDSGTLVRFAEAIAVKAGEVVRFIPSPLRSEGDDTFDRLSEA